MDHLERNVTANLDKSAWAKYETVDKRVHTVLKSVDDSARKQRGNVLEQADALLNIAKWVEAYSAMLTNNKIDWFSGVNYRGIISIYYAFLI